jgi:hypothetical protein
MDSNNFCDLFAEFGKVYENVSIEKIEKLSLPCYFDGVDYKALTPKDTDCNFNYFRLLNEKPIYVDTGHCGQTIGRIKQTYKWVYFATSLKNTDAIIKKFQNTFSGDFNLRIESIEKNPNKLMKSECNLTFDVRLKNYTYLSIDFTISPRYNNCITENNCI